MASENQTAGFRRGQRRQSQRPEVLPFLGYDPSLRRVEGLDFLPGQHYLGLVMGQLFQADGKGVFHVSQSVVQFPSRTGVFLSGLQDVPGYPSRSDGRDPVSAHDLSLVEVLS
jgi:hypothetical protein